LHFPKVLYVNPFGETQLRSLLISSRKYIWRKEHNLWTKKSDGNNVTNVSLQLKLHLFLLTPNLV